MTDINDGLPPNDLRLFLRTISMATPEQVIMLGRESADHIDALEASNKSLVEALAGLREFVRDEEFCLCEYKDNTTPADEGPEIDAADAAIAVAKEAT